tara:strand:+ start:3995 stop:4225 length:231 start_codon:yes stop_codon:yes gene_type:complete
LGYKIRKLKGAIDVLAIASGMEALYTTFAAPFNSDNHIVYFNQFLVPLTLFLKNILPSGILILTVLTLNHHWILKK